MFMVEFSYLKILCPHNMLQRTGLKHLHILVRLLSVRGIRRKMYGFV